MQTSVHKTHDHTCGYILDFHVFDIYWIAVALFLLLSGVRVFPVLLFEVFTVIWDFFFFFPPSLVLNSFTFYPAVYGHNSSTMLLLYIILRSSSFVTALSVQTLRNWCIIIIHI